MGDRVSASRRSAIERMLRPRSIAVVGASASPGSLGAGLLANLERFRFRGDVHLVNAARSEIDGRACLSSIALLPEGTDCAVLAIPRSGVLDAVKGCAEHGVGGVVIYAAGFAEAGAHGAAVQKEIARIARAHGMAVAGPNCLGHINYVDEIPLTFSACAPMQPSGRRGVAVLSQSGAMATVLRAALHARGVALSFSVSTGNEAVETVEDFLDYVIDDPATHVVLMLVEQFRQPQHFLALARRACAAGKPIALLHPGRSAAARVSAKTHTGALAGDYEVMRAMVAHQGVAVVDSLEELIDLGELLVRWPTPPRGGAAIISDSGAFKALALDFCEGSDLGLPEPSEATREVLAALAPDLILPTNPLDLTAQALIDPDLYRKAMAPLLGDTRVGCLVLAVVLSSPTHSARKMAPIIAALEDLGPRKPVVFAMLGEDTKVADEIIDKLRALGVPFFRSPERALRALARLAGLRTPPAQQPPRPEPRATPARLPPGIVPEHVAKGLLVQAGIPVPRGLLTTDLQAARDAATRIGYPVVLKAQAAALAHKSDVGGVALGLRDQAALAGAWHQLHADIAKARPDVALDGIVVEAMVRNGVELMLGARRDPDWGLVLVVGLGGIWAEALRDVRLLPSGLDPDAIIAAMQRLKGAAVLRGVRGAPALDLHAVAEAACRLDGLIGAHPEIAEIDINPLIVYPNRDGVVAVDALMVVR
ncbi:MAG TPA: acetate--CoA ligase family protein [Xanthobacteraceae bacterium]|nr:acetate--CoA ligase family protein [Xanthobacteraceae bacterium]